MDDTEESLDEVFREQVNIFTGEPYQLERGRIYRLDSGLPIPLHNQNVLSDRINRLSRELPTPVDCQLQPAITRRQTAKRLHSSTKSKSKPKKNTRRKRKLPFMNWFIRKISIRRRPESGGWFINKFSFWKQNHPDQNDEES